MNRHFTNVGTKYIKKPQPVSEEMQFKTIRYPFMLIRLANMKKPVTKYWQGRKGVWSYRVATSHMWLLNTLNVVNPN